MLRHVNVQESHSLVNLKTCHAQDIYEGCDSRTSSFRISIFSLDGRMVSFFGIANQGVKKEQRPPGRSPQPLQRAVVAPGRN